ncbi:sesquipedalian-1-like isoform X1 [Xyrauchen texanus]|uniref:sesquipedalian-1-like isoform X1 n=1 Tax=Xyrauchen texanus TaxID=154827 RepID=UPI00224268AA|nr:sesquipedalian-1-like isoform X1 [Xyrauchen texanus]XP_051995345.1 sesquipedalian-1-like isoform X1 [Xyrauchen texanus]
MKIHKKILTHYLSCTSPVDKEGYLYKKKERNTTYLRRWFVLKGNLLFYQERPGDRNLLGVIVLEGCMVQACEMDGQFCFSLVFTGPGLRTYRLAAENQLSQESWISALLCSGHIYLSMIVRDMERLYEEAKKEKGLCYSTQSSAVTSTLGEKVPNNTMASWSTGHSYFMHGASILPRDGRSYSTSSVPPSSMPKRPISCSLHAPPVPFKTTNKRSPKVWPKRNAHVTPLNSAAPSYGEWPVVSFDPLEEFSKLHEYYGNEIKQLRADWLKKREEEGYIVEDLIDLG